MGARQIRPAGVYQAVTTEMKNRILQNDQVMRPPWYNIMSAVPPSETLVRPIPTQHRKPNPRASRTRNLYRPQNITYPEDALRNNFFKDHPWELARPRVVMELDGKDYQMCDWSKGLKQPGIPLSGECVVQRQLWLMETQNMPKRKAYDLVRKEFYRLRQEEEIERRVALEEARHVGGYFGRTRLDVGMFLEDQEFEKWKVWAGKVTAAQEAQVSSEIDTFGEEDEKAVDPMDGPPLAKDLDESAAPAPGANI